MKTWLKQRDTDCPIDVYCPVDFKELLKAQGLTPEQFDKKYIEYENVSMYKVELNKIFDVER